MLQLVFEFLLFYSVRSQQIVFTTSNYREVKKRNSLKLLSVEVNYQHRLGGLMESTNETGG